MTTYGTMRFTFCGTAHVATLTSAGWRLDPLDPTLLETLESFASPDDPDIGPADGDRPAALLDRAAGLFHGVPAVIHRPGPPPGTIY